MAAIPTMRSFVLDCPDPLALARFYADLLGLEVRADSTPEWANVQLSADTKLAFQLAPEHEPPGWPGGEPIQAHLDLTAPDLDASHEHTLAVGTVVADPEDSREKAVSQGFRAYLDPAGHPFCLCQDDDRPWS